MRQYNAQYHGAASGIGEAEPGRRTHRNTRTYCCAVRWMVTDKDIILIANFGGLITENRIPQLGSFFFATFYEYNLPVYYN